MGKTSTSHNLNIQPCSNLIGVNQKSRHDQIKQAITPRLKNKQLISFQDFKSISSFDDLDEDKKRFNDINKRARNKQTIQHQVTNTTQTQSLQKCDSFYQNTSHLLLLSTDTLSNQSSLVKSSQQNQQDIPEKQRHTLKQYYRLKGVSNINNNTDAELVSIINYRIQQNEKYQQLLSKIADQIQNLINQQVETINGVTTISKDLCLNIFVLIHEIYQNEYLNFKNQNQQKQQIKDENLLSYIEESEKFNIQQQLIFQTTFTIVCDKIGISQIEYCRNFEIFLENLQFQKDIEQIQSDQIQITDNQDINIVQNTTRGTMIRDVIQVLYDIKFYLLKPCIKEHLCNISGEDLRNFIDTLLSDLMFKSTNLTYTQYIALIKKHNTLNESQVKQKCDELIDMIFQIKERIYGRRSVRVGKSQKTIQNPSLYQDQLHLCLQISPQQMFKFDRCDTRQLIYQIASQNYWSDMFLGLDGEHIIDY